MQIIYVPGEAPAKVAKSLFLAGPSPRSADQPNWRPEAIAILEELGYDGTVFIPLPADGDFSHGFDAQIHWERKHLDLADVIVFWVPRDLEKLPGFTTNVEFGTYHDTGRVIFGAPEGAPGTRYLQSMAVDVAMPICHDLRATLAAAVAFIGDGATRTGGERDVPLSVWKLPSFQEWYVAQRTAGHRLDSARVLWNYRSKSRHQKIFSFALKVDLFLPEENRHKSNEFILARPDVAAVVAYHKPVDAASWLDTEVVLVSEVRAAADTSDARVHELPGGSTWEAGQLPEAEAAEELAEETGLSVEVSRLRPVSARQVAATMLTHRVRLFSLELTSEEIETLRRDHATHGLAADTERTTVQIMTIREIIAGSFVDWANLGMILATLK